MAQKDEILSSRSESPGGDFVLHSNQGKFSLKQLRGKVVLLYFGYTKCPDVCPTSLSIIAQALNELSEDELNSVQGVFISVDPKRDNVQVLDEYVRHFHPNLVGITGAEDEVAGVARRYGAQYEEVVIEGSDFGYAVNHSSVTYLITPEGDLRFMLPHQTPAFVILEAIRYLLADTM
ncbi:MAG: SCO family protein [Candidatus Thiodiazotropha endolucinida]|nr:SCO family protein [Candidatus Thiodiazotropha endolucinida]